MLDYKLVEAFATVISAGGFDKAAHLMGLTQSAVSQRVKQLEEQYGSLLLRRTSPPRPTESGSELLTHYTRVKQLEDDLDWGSKQAQDNYSSLSIGLNQDSFATWFPEAVSEIIRNNGIVLDLHLDDQDKTHELMQSGTVWGCITTKRTALQGCKATYLGLMRYGVYAERMFRDEHFREGVTFDACQSTPAARFNRKDDLNNRLYHMLFKRDDLNPPYFYIPSPEKYAEFILSGHCYGIMPVIQASQLDSGSRLVDLLPDTKIDVHLYWHCWTLKSKTMAHFDTQFTTLARKLLAAHT